jgi:hypothetical protein
MSRPTPSILALCSRPSTPRSAPRAAAALRLVLTATARSAFLKAGRDGETPISRTKKRHDSVADGARR